MRFKLKLSLRSLFIILTVAVIVFGLRYQRRLRIQIASQKIKELGGEVFLVCQEPRIRSYSHMVEDVIAYPSRNPPLFPELNEMRLTKTVQPRSEITAFLFGTTADVEVFAVSISAASIDDEIVRLLQQLGGVEVVLLNVSEDYLRFKYSERITADSRETQLERRGKDFRRATDLIARGIPMATIYQGNLEESDPKTPQLYIPKPTGDKFNYDLLEPWSDTIVR